MKTFLFAALLCLFYLPTIAQSDTCNSHLKSASNNYDQGNFDEAIAALNVTIKNCPLSNEELLQANKLLTMCYLAIDNLEAADKTVETIMKIDPNYTPDKFNDDPKYVSLFEKYKPQPTISVGISGGMNWPVIHVEKTYSVVHDDDTDGLASYEQIGSYQFGLNAEGRLFNNLWIGLDFQFRNTRYKHTLDSVEGNTINYSEKMNYSDFPLSLKYYFPIHSFAPYLQAGANFSYLIQALSTTTREGESDLVNRTGYRNQFMVGYFGAAGASYTVHGFVFFGNFRYTWFPDQVNETGTRYADEINLYKYYYVDDDFKMDNIQFNIGASYILAYKITKTGK